MNDDATVDYAGHERRRYFRIQDTVRLSFRVVPREQIADQLERLEEGFASDFTLMSSLVAISAQTAVHLRRIESENPDLAACLRALEQKIEIIGRTITARDADIEETHAQPVNLSAGGMALQLEKPVEVGSSLEIKMLLFPSFTGILTYGEVVECRPLRQETAAEPPHYLMRVDFTHLRDQDRDVLIRHVLRRQGHFLQEQRRRRDISAGAE